MSRHGVTTGRHDYASERFEWLSDVGFDEASATIAARDLRFDVHALMTLADQGCPPPVAVRILAPLDVEVAQ